LDVKHIDISMHMKQTTVAKSCRSNSVVVEFKVLFKSNLTDDSKICTLGFSLNTRAGLCNFSTSSAGIGNIN